MPPLDDAPLPGAEFRRSPEERHPQTNGAASLDWDDVRVFLAVAREGSLRAAGRVLGLSQPTVGRRLASFEAAFGGPALFDRLPEGLRLNAAGAALVETAEQLEDAALALERRHAATSPALSGTVRVSVGEWAAVFLAGALAGGSPKLPDGITVELVESQQTANLARREADLAVRHHPPEGGDLYIAKLGTFAAAVYRRTDCIGEAWVTYTEEQAHFPTARWVQQRIDETGAPVALRASRSLTMQLAAIRAGAGQGLLPCFVGDADPSLARVTPPVPEVAADYWVIVHRDLRRAVCVRAVIDWVRALFAERRDALAGDR